MQRRRLMPNPLGDARWGYIDRFETNPYWMPALAVTVGFVAATLVVVPRLMRERPQDSRVERVRFEETSQVLPVPDFIVPPSTDTRPIVRQRVAGRPRPVAEVVPEAEISTTATTAAPSDASEFGDDALSTGVRDTPSDGTPATNDFPDAETFIPVEHAPELVAMATPTYPELARDAGIEGTVIVRVLVGRDGFVHEARLVSSVLGLDDAALAAARDAVFKPALQQDKPVAVWIVIPIEFRLRQ